MSWVISRTPQLSFDAAVDVEKIINSKLNPKHFEPTEQDTEKCERSYYIKQKTPYI